MDSVSGALLQALAPFASLSSLGDVICCAAYGLFAIFFAQRLLRGSLPVTALAMVFLAALATSAVWAGVALVDGLRHWSDHLPAWVVPSLDLLRFALWFAFLSMLLPPARRGGGLGWVRPVASVAVLGQLALILIAEGEPPGSLTRPLAFGALSLAVIGLVLVEQMLRNSTADARWNAKPVCLGLGGIFVFDLFIGSQAALFQNFDGDAVSVRSLVHSAAVPLLFVASRRHGDWLGKLHVSRAAVFHSAALLLVGAYLLMVAGVGYYVRYTGGQWGRALSVALVFVALVALALLVASGSMRARLRVYISKNFFSYRYDYRNCCRAALSPGTPRKRWCVRWPTWSRAPVACCGCSAPRMPISCRPRAGTCRPSRAASLMTARSLRSGASVPGSSMWTSGAGGVKRIQAWSCLLGCWTSRAAGSSSRCWCVRP
jgi:hypothetical protein